MDATPKPKKKSLMEKFVNSKFMKGLQKVGQKVGSNRGISALTSSMMTALGVLLVGSIFQILAVVPESLNWVSSSSLYYEIMMLPYNATVNLFGIFMAGLIAYNFGKSLKLNPIQTMLGSLVVYFMVCSPFITATVTSGTTTTSITALNTKYLGTQGIFPALIIGLSVTGIYKLFDKYKLYIRLPDVIPAFLTESFKALTPLLVSTILFIGIEAALSPVNMTLPAAIMFCLQYPLKGLTSIWGVILCVVLGLTFWFFGIHGGAIIVPIFLPIMLMQMAANANIVSTSGAQALTFATGFTGAFLILLMGSGGAGGSGNTLALCVMSWNSKSKRLRAVGRSSLIPGLFNISEPMVFGYPMMYNSILMIPFIFNPVITILIVYGLFACNFFKCPYIYASSTLPFGIGWFLMSMSWQDIFIPFIAFAVAFVCYYPFYKVYEKQMVAEEEAQAEKEKISAVASK